MATAFSAVVLPKCTYSTSLNSGFISAHQLRCNKIDTHMYQSKAQILLRANKFRSAVHKAVSTAVDIENESDTAKRAPVLPFRIGHGFDLHRLEPGLPLIIGGIRIAHDRGCDAHSDGAWIDLKGRRLQEGDLIGLLDPSKVSFQTLRAMKPSRPTLLIRDVLLHCVVDAILGALGLPDIGQLFPDNDSKWRGADSSVFLKEAVRLMHEAGYELGNLDATLILQRPKVSPHKEAIRTNLCELLGSDPSVINLKAKTHEKVDSLGENRSIAAHTIVLLMKK